MPLDQSDPENYDNLDDTLDVADNVYTGSSPALIIGAPFCSRRWPLGPPAAIAGGAENWRPYGQIPEKPWLIDL
jgi:hypothetical protein